MTKRKTEMKKRKRKRAEFISPSKGRTARRYSLPESKKKTQKKKRKCSSRHCRHSATEGRTSGSSKKRRPQHLESRKRGKGISSKTSPQNRSEEPQKKTTFIVLQQNMRSLSSSERLEELFNELHRVEWDVILISETWRQNKEIWETQQGHIMVESGKFNNKHGVVIQLNKRWKNEINWVQCECERVVAMSISINKQPIVLVSVYMPHSGYADHHFEKVHKTIAKMIEREKSMKIIGGDFNAELGPGEVLELSAVGHYTLNKGNNRGEWMTQRLLQNKLVALNTMYKKAPLKQATYCTSKDAKKQLDYILTDRKHYQWSRDAEVSDTIHMGSDHRCVMARFEIPKKKEKGKSRKTKAPLTEQQSEKSDDGKQQKYLDLEQRVKEAEPGKNTESVSEEKDEAGEAAANREAKAEEAGWKTTADASAAPAAAAADEDIEQSHAAASEGTAAPEAQETNEKVERIRALIQERKTTAKHSKDRIREISKEIKKIITDNKRLKRQENPKRFWKKSKVQRTYPVSNQ